VGRGEVVGPVVERELSGRPAEVANALHTMYRNGNLVSWTPVGYHRGPDPVAVVKVRVIDRQPAARRSRTGWVVAGAAVVVTALGVAGYLAYAAAGPGPMAGILTGAVAVLVAWLRRRWRSRG
jgi:hypothetical protein